MSRLKDWWSRGGGELRGGRPGEACAGKSDIVGAAVVVVVLGSLSEHVVGEGVRGMVIRVRGNDREIDGERRTGRYGRSLSTVGLLILLSDATIHPQKRRRHFGPTWCGIGAGPWALVGHYRACEIGS